MTSSEVRDALVRPETSPFYWRRNFVALPNSNSFTSWEADLLVCSNAGYLTEIEIKVTRQDWRNDKKKDKFKWLAQEGRKAYGWGFIKQFYYAVPMELAIVWGEIGIPAWAGVIGINPVVPGQKYSNALCVKPAEQFTTPKLNDKQLIKLARLAACRIWTS